MDSGSVLWTWLYTLHSSFNSIEWILDPLNEPEENDDDEPPFNSIEWILRSKYVARGADPEIPFNSIEWIL